MSSKRRGLGKGLQALIPVAEEGTLGAEQLKEIEIDAIHPSLRQARRLFDQEKLEELAASIKEHGVIQPVVVRPLDGGGYELIAGERRWRACQQLGLSMIPAVIKEYRDLEASAVSLIENIQREDLNPLEEASAYHQLMEDFGLTQEEVSGRVGKSRSMVANMVRLLALPVEIKDMLASGNLNAGHARALLVIKDREKQLAAAGRIAKQQLSVRQAEKIAKTITEKKERDKVEKKLKKKYLLQVEENLSTLLDARVKVKEDSGGGGKLELTYKNEADLRRILTFVMGERKE